MAADSYAPNPFTVLIDSAEGTPWTFDGLKADANRRDLPLWVPTAFANLGRHPYTPELPGGDYSIAGFVGQVAVERKSLTDCQATILGWDSQYNIENGTNGRRARFKNELASLSRIHSAIVIVEAPLEQVLREMPGCDGEDYFNELTGEINQTRGVKTVRENRKTLFRSIVSWQQRPEYRVPWMFCGSRREAEVFCFRYLEKFYEHQEKEIRRRHRTAVRAVDCA
jgi:hypothetical protein